MLYLWFQAAAVAAWWVLLLALPGFRARFVFAGCGDDALLAFAGADLALVACGSIAVAHGLARERQWALYAFSLVLGATCYATLYCVGAAWLTDSGGLGTALMLLCTAANAVAYHLARRHRRARKAGAIA